MLVFRSLLSLLAFMSSVSSALASDILTRPWLAKVRVSRPEQGQNCTQDAEVAYKRLTEEYDAVLFGWPPPIFEIKGSGCGGTIFFASKSYMNPDIFSRIFGAVNLTAEFVVDNNRGSYMGYTVVANFKNGSYDYCARSDERLSPYSSWIEGYENLDRRVSDVKRLDLESKLRWLQLHFRCPNADKLTSVDIVFDLTNEEVCPLDSGTFRSCFIIRGFQKYRIDL